MDQLIHLDLTSSIPTAKGLMQAEMFVFGLIDLGRIAHAKTCGRQ
jgi:hypothetical protein